MGNTASTDNEKSDTWWPPPQTEIIEINNEHTSIPSTSTEIQITEKTIDLCENIPNTSVNTEEEYENSRRRQREQKIKEFRSEWEKKHIARREAIAERSREITFLRDELEKYKRENEQLKDLVKQTDTNEAHAENLEEVKYELHKLKTENENLQKKIFELNEEMNKSNEITKQNRNLRKGIAEAQKDLQAVNTQVLEFEKERHDYETHVIALKDVIKVSKSLLEIRENQLRELKTKVADIETSLAEREVSMMSTDLKDEYERQLENIRSLRALYEQRQAATKAERDLMASQLSDAKNNLENEQKKIGEMQERINELEENVSDKYDQIKSLESQLGLAKAEYRGLEAEMSVINQLFSQILFGFNNCREIDFDKLIKLLEENHDVLTNIAINEESEAISSVLPKTLLDLVNQVAEETKNADSQSSDDNQDDIKETNSNEEAHVSPEETNHTEQPINSQMNSAEEIVNKLPKVWRILIELLRQQCGQQPVDIQDGTDPCYKSVETPKGPKMVLSVSKTFIRLKDLILEKKSLEKEMSRLKQLNTHLEVRLQDQEKRLETVSSELSKTWHVVGRMQRQHQQLHTHEKILRYELGQKRKMLTDLKQELEYCREKWEQAREKNSSTEEEWKKLRSEFASRKAVTTDEFNNSAESGYSDEPDGSSDEETIKQNKIPLSSNNDKEQKSEDTNISDIKIEASINNQGKDVPNDKTFAECSNSNVKQKTETEVQNVIRKTQPASLDMIDDVCALAISPVVIVNDVFSNQFNEIISSNNQQISQNLPNTEDIITRNDISENQTHSKDITETTNTIEINNSSPRETEIICNNNEPTVININANNESHTSTKQINQVVKSDTSHVYTNNNDIPIINDTETESQISISESISTKETNEIVTNNSSHLEPKNVSNSASNTIENNVLLVNEANTLAKKVIQGENTENTSKVCNLIDTPSTSTEVLLCNNNEPTVININANNESHTSTKQINQVVKSDTSHVYTNNNDIPIINDTETESQISISESISTKETNEIVTNNSSRLEPENVSNSASNTIENNVLLVNEANTLTKKVTQGENTENTSKVCNLIDTPSTSSASTSTEVLTQDERLQRREERLRRLEEQCRQLVKKVANTNSRSTEIHNRLDALHEQYGNDNPRTNVQQDEEISENVSNDTQTLNTELSD